jgi:hypothetical protein
MPDLSRDQRGTLKTTIEMAREVAEAGAAEALRRVGVFLSRRPDRLDDGPNETRKRFRAHAKSLGDSLSAPDGETLQRLTEAAAYVQWHRLLFSRFLLERGLLRDESGVALSLSDCREEAAMEENGDEWSVAATFTARMLPGVFPAEDPVEALVLAPEHAKALRDLLLKLDAAIFQADDSLGWTYQFWRAAEKKAINESGRKIGAAELPAVTQLFTEPYMVRFLLHNTLGAWWAGKVLAAQPDMARDAADENALRTACGLPDYAWDFLRFVKEDDTWRPVARMFPDWPPTAAALTVLDPCCGSGHFLTEALAALAALRGVEEALSPADAVVAVLRDNLAGLEIDGRCVQIAAFALAMAAWRIGGGGLALPTPRVAWVGGPPPLPKSEFAALANGDMELRRGLEALHDLFVHGPTLGSLIEPVGGDLIDPTRVARIEDSIAEVLKRMHDAEPDRAEGALAARGMADATAILVQRWVLQATNVPFLAASKQSDSLKSYCQRRFSEGKQNLAATFLLRMLDLASAPGIIAVVTPQDWYSLGGYRKLRARLTAENTVLIAADLGPAAFHDMNWWAARTALTVYGAARPARDARLSFIDAEAGRDPAIKSDTLKQSHFQSVLQSDLRKHPDVRIIGDSAAGGELLGQFADVRQGIGTADMERFVQRFWEHPEIPEAWTLYQLAPTEDALVSGQVGLLRWESGAGVLSRSAQARVCGQPAWGKQGIAAAVTRSLARSPYLGTHFDCTAAAIIPKDEIYLPAIFAFVMDREFPNAVRAVDKSLSVTESSFTKVRFDLAHWQSEASQRYPGGLPEPYSDDPTQWVFHAHPRNAVAGTELHIALARLSGYRWPAETDSAIRLSTTARARIAEAATLPAARCGRAACPRPRPRRALIG